MTYIESCSMCNKDTRTKDLNYIDNLDTNGFCRNCWYRIQKTNSVNYYDNYPETKQIYNQYE